MARRVLGVRAVSKNPMTVRFLKLSTMSTKRKNLKEKCFVLQRSKFSKVKEKLDCNKKSLIYCHPPPKMVK